ncbi:MAG: SPFH domain-containing protein [Oscillospiraceae bacterium]
MRAYCGSCLTRQGFANIRVVQQSQAYVIERLGAFSAVWGVGIHFKVPFLERVAKRVSLEGAGLWTIPPARHHQGQRHHADRYRDLFPDH